MRLTTVILIATLMQVSASSLAQKITLQKSRVQLKTILQDIRKQSGYNFVYTDVLLQKAAPVTISVKAAELDEVLGQIFEQQPLTYEINNKTVVVKEKTPSFLDKVTSVFADDDGKFADIRGVVRNERGEPLEGITVTVKGAKTGTRTNAKGEFLLKGVKKGDVLVFTGVAIEPFEYTVKDDKNIDLNLKARLVQLEEVNVEYSTGYQKISKERAVGAFEQLDSAAFHRRVGMGILERLDGTINGMLFNKNGGNIPSIQIRGLSTIQSHTSPLVIVDNFPYNYDLSTINPNDVENITVLKDAAASSIWGARAGNGVIVITTKKGKFNQPLIVSWNSNINIQAKPDLYYYPQVSSSDFIDFEESLFSKGAYSSKLNSIFMNQVSPVIEILNKIEQGELTEVEGKARINQLRTIDYRDQLNKYVYQSKVAQQHHVSLSGGSGVMNYQFSAGYNHTKPAIQNSSWDDQYTLSSSAGVRILKTINLNLGLNLSQSNQRSAAFPQFAAYPYIPLADEKGNALVVPKFYRLSYLDTVGKGQLLDWQFRPLDEIKLSDLNNASRMINVNARVDYAATSWLNFGLQGQYNLNSSESKNLQSVETYMARDLINRFTNLSFTEPQFRYPIPVGGIMDMVYGKANTYNLRGDVSINKNWRDHQLSIMLAGDISESKTGFSNFRFYGYQPDFGGIDPTIDYRGMYIDHLGVESQLPSGNQSGDENSNRFVSLSGNALYSYLHKYSIYASARRDGSNLFGVKTNNKWKPLWSVGFAWNVDKEKFFKIGWIDQLKMKATYGYSGNANNALSGLPTIFYDQFPDTYSGLRVAYFDSPSNPSLRWEQVKTYNVGIDVSIFNNRISSSFNYFKKISTDLIGSIAFPISTGITNFPVNASSLKGNGFELNISAKILEGSFRWQSNYGLSYAKTIVTNIYKPNNFKASDFLGLAINPSVGKIAFGLSSYRWAGLDPQTGDPRGYLKGEISKDYDAIALDSVDSQMFHGSSVPLCFGLLTNTFSWKSISLSFNINYRFGFYFRRSAIDYSSLIEKNNLPVDYYERWQKPGDEQSTNVPSLIFPSTNSNRDIFYTNSEVNVLRGDNIRLQDLRIQYSFQQDKTRLPFVKSLNFFIYMNNLNMILWRKNKSKLDPDFANGTQSLIPVSKSIALGLTTTF